VRNLFAVLAFCLITGVAGSTVIFWSIAAHGLHAPSIPRGTEAFIDRPRAEHELSSQPPELNIETTTLPADMDPYAGSMMTFPLR
jgi:hypothetical protein